MVETVCVVTVVSVMVLAGAVCVIVKLAGVSAVTNTVASSGARSSSSRSLRRSGIGKPRLARASRIMRRATFASIGLSSMVRARTAEPDWRAATVTIVGV